jgi:hypothetical protein
MRPGSHSLNQGIYSILERAKMTSAKPVSTPMATSPALSKFEGLSMSDPLP